MKSRLIFLCIAGLAALAPLALLAQPEYMPRFKAPKQAEAVEEEEAEEEEAPAPKAKKKKDAKMKKGRPEEAAPSGTDTKSINAYLMGRLKELQESHAAQETFGRKFNSAWMDFWQGIFNERKDFDIKMARQRLNHFQTLSSLDAAYRRQATSDFEKLQSGLTRSFENSQRKKLDEFFSGALGDIKTFGSEQDKWLLQFMAESDAAWKAQKGQ